jgi:hypothetical protein
MKYTSPSYLKTMVETNDVITASKDFTVSESGTTSSGDKIYDAIVDINDYLAGANK